MGPGFPRILGIPSIAAADRFAPFLRPSLGGAIDVDTGVPSAAGVAALDSDELPSLAAPDFSAAGDAKVAEGAGESSDSFDPFES